MQTFLSIQRWFYSGMSEGLGAVAAGNPHAILLALAAAILFGTVHALMRGNGKTVLVSYLSGQGAGPFEGFVNGAIVAITHVGLAVILVVAGFAVISRACQRPFHGAPRPHRDAASPHRHGPRNRRSARCSRPRPVDD